MLAITVPAPRAIAIARYGCRLINRPGIPTDLASGTVVAIHAAARERAIYTECERVALLTRIEFKHLRRQSEAARGRVVALARFTGWHTAQRDAPGDRRWWMGPVGWTLDDVQAIEGMVSAVSPVGSHTAWELPVDATEDVERAILEKLGPHPRRPRLPSLAVR